MTYSAVYCALISKRLKNPITKEDCYCERHHIIPKSEGGDDDPQNLVNLTAREHYIAHLLLARIYKDRKMSEAIVMMRTKRIRGRVFKYNSRLFQLEKIRLAKQRSEDMKGRTPWNKGVRLSEEQKRNMQGANKGNKFWLGKHHTEAAKEKLRKFNLGKHSSDETRRKLSEVHKGNKYNLGKKLPEATKKKMSETHKRIGNKPPSPLGKHWFNNGITETYSFECPEGFVKGRLKK